MDCTDLELDLDKVTEVIESYIRTLADESEKGCVLMGLSGGIDSSVLLTLAVRAVGNEDVAGEHDVVLDGHVLEGLDVQGRGRRDAVPDVQLRLEGLGHVVPLRMG